MSLTISTGLVQQRSTSSGSSEHLTPSNSPSLRGPSTDNDERERSSYSSPSTGFTSVDDEEASKDEDEQLVPFSSNPTEPIAATSTRVGVVAPAASTSGLRWRMPFAKSSTGPKPTNSNGSSSGSPPRRQTKRDQEVSKHVPESSESSVMDDGSFVETTSAQAALALAQYWNDVKRRESLNGKGKGRAVDNENEDYVVVARVENGKKIFRIRPRSPPGVAPDAPAKLDSKPASSHANLPRAPSIRLTRSIPNLGSARSSQQPDTSPLSSIYRDEDGFYRTGATLSAGSSASPYLELPTESTHPLLPQQSTRPRNTSLGTAVSIPNLRAERDGDVFGRLLGWSYSTPPTSVIAAARPALEIGDSFRTAKTHQTDTTVTTMGTIKAKELPKDPAAIVSYQSRPPELRTPITDTFPAAISASSKRPQAVPMARAATTGRIVPDATGSYGAPSPSSSPFGQGVRLPSSPRLRRRKSMGELPLLAPPPAVEVSEDISQTEQEPPRALREAASSETIRTSTYVEDAMPMAQTAIVSPEVLQDDCQTPFGDASKKAAQISSGTLDTRIFDVMQHLESSEWKRDSSASRPSLHVDAVDGRRHQRGMSSTSLASVTSLLSGSSASSNSDKPHEITVTVTTGDDPRFVIWGIKQTAGQQRQSQHLQAAPTSATLSGNLESPTNVANTGSKGSRWSGSKRRYTLSDSSAPVSSTTPTTPSTPTQLSASKVLMAATIERWIAEMTSKIEADLMTDFFLTYRSFLSPMALCQLLITRFEWALASSESAEDIAGRRIVRVRTYVVVRYWLLNYFHEDYVPDRELRVVLTEWLNRMGKDERLRASPTDLRLVKSLKKVVKRLKAAYSTIGAEEAIDANKLILDSNCEKAGRARAGTASSTASLQSIQEKSIQPYTQEGHTVSISHVMTQSAASSAAPSDSEQEHRTHLTKDKMRTSSSEDDVDLDIDIHASGYDSDERPSIPRVIPISPPRHRHRSPRINSSARSPQLGSDRSPRLLNTLPTMPDTNRLSRYLTSTVGSFGKLKRIMGSKTPSQGHGSMHLDGSLGMVAGDHSVDLLSSKGGLDTFLKQRGIETTDDPRSSTEKGGLGIYGLTADAQAEGLSATSGATATAMSTPNLHHVASSSTIRRQEARSRLSQRASRQNNLEDSPLQPAFVEQSTTGASGPTIQLDDYDSSDDESMYGGTTNVVRKIRRLPAARDLRNPGAGGAPAMSYRHSIDTLSSYGTTSVALQPIRVPSFATYDSHESSANDDDLDAMAGEGVIPFFVTPVDSDDEEPGDVAAALRRLEGLVDQDKQRSKAKKVEMYLQKSEDAKANGGYMNEQMDGDEADEGAEQGLDTANPGRTSLRSVVEDSAVPAGDASKNDANAGLAVPLELATKLSQENHRNALAVLPAATMATDPKRLTATTSRKSVQRKSSVRRFFTGSRTSTSLRPVSTLPAPSAGSLPPVPAHRSFILDHKTDILARHFCIIERDLLEKVSWQELVSGEWRHRLEIGDITSWDAYLKQRARANADMQTQASAMGYYGSRAKKIGDVQTIIQRFNLMCNWIASEIVLTTNTVTRALLIAKIIRLAFKCYRVYNFQTVTQLIHGLQSPYIERLKRTWNRVPAYEMRLFGQLKFFCSHLRNFRLLREATESLASQWGPPGQETGSGGMDLPGVPGAVPFFGLILRDLAVSSELPTYLDPSSPRAPAVINTDTGLLYNYVDPQVFADLPPIPSDLPLRPLVNVHKYRTIATIIQKVMTFKELATSYPYEPDLAVYRKCLTLHCLPPPLISQLSSACEK